MEEFKKELQKAIDEALLHGAVVSIDEYFNGMFVQPEQVFKYERKEGMELSKIKETVRIMCNSFGIDQRFMFALIETESNWNQWAVKYEPGYRWYMEEPDTGRFKNSPETNKEMQSFSYGLCQVMGNHFYEQGFTGFCTQLVDPKLNTVIAIKILERHIKKGVKLPMELYAAYNAGSVRVSSSGDFVNQANVDRFMKIYNKTEV